MTRPFQAPGPTPHPRPLSSFAMLRAVRANPVAIWSRRHYQELMVDSRSPMGRMVVVSDPALVKRVLVDNAANYHKDRLQRRVLTAELGQGLVLAEGEVWRTQRRVLAPLFSRRCVADFQEPAARVATEFIATLERTNSADHLDLAEAMARTTLRVLASTIFAGGLMRATEDIAHAVGQYMEFVGKIDPLDVLALPAWIPRLGKLRARPALRFFDATVRAMIEDRRTVLERDDGAAPFDLLTLLLREGLSESEVRANIVTFIATGHEPVSNALTWALYLVSQDTGVRDRLEREVDRELPDRRYLPGSLDRLVFTQAVIEEAIRLYPPAATITRDAAAADRLGDLDIAAGTHIVVSPWLLHRHDRLWDEPNGFAPERFLRPNRATIDRFAYLPFGAGPRICIGASFALQQTAIVLATLVRSYRFTLRPGHPIVPVQRLSLRPRGGMPMLAQRRGHISTCRS